MAASGEQPLAEFVRHLIDRWLADGKTLRALKLAAGWAKTNSTVDNIKAGSEVTEFSGSKLAPALGYRDFADMVSAAYTWWRSDRTELPQSGAETPLAEAVRIARGYAVTGEQISRAIDRIKPEHQPAVDALTWLAMFHDEKSADARVDAELRAAGHRAAQETAARATAQAELRGATEKKRQEADAPRTKRRSKAG